MQICMCIPDHWHNRLFANGSAEQGSILGQVITKTKKSGA